MGKILVDLWSFMRAKSYNDQDYLTQPWFLDDIVFDMCPLFDKWDRQYSQKFISKWLFWYYPQLAFEFNFTNAYKMLMFFLI